MQELKPCPFCGGVDIEISYRDIFSRDFRRGVYCATCGGGIYPYKETEAEAIKAWNTRAEKLVGIHQPKSIVKVDKVTGEIVERYPSGKKAAIENGLAPRTVTDAARYNILTAGRYFYRKEDEYDPAEVWEKGKKNRPIIGVHKERGIIRQFINPKAAAKYTGTMAGTISFNASGRIKKRRDGWQFRYQTSPADWMKVKEKAEAAGIMAVDEDTKEDTNVN